MTPQSIERIIAKQIRQWHLHQELMKLDAAEDVRPPRPVITISRELGSGGMDLALSLSRRLEFQIHGKSLIDQIAQDKGLEQKVVEQLDERTRSEVDMWVESLLKRRLFSQSAFHLSVAKAVKTLASLGGVIILGRGAHAILGGDNTLRVRVVAPADVRIARVMEREGVDEAQARQMIATSDSERAEFHRKLYGVVPNDPYQYDLVLNTERMRGDRAVSMVLAAMEARGLFG
jgi:cytidylate kinase